MFWKIQFKATYKFQEVKKKKPVGWLVFPKLLELKVEKERKMESSK